MLAALSLTAGFAFADEFTPLMSTKDVGTVLYDDAQTVGAILSEPRDFSAGIIPEEVTLDVGTALYNEQFAEHASIERGSAAGGMQGVDENTRIWDNLVGPAGGSDLP